MTEYNTLAEALDANKIKSAGKAIRKHTAIRDQHKRVKELTPEQIAAKYAGRRDKRRRQRTIAAQA